MLIEHITTTEGDIDKNKVIKLLNNYNAIYEDGMKDIEIPGKTLAQCNKEHASLCAFYGEKKTELKQLSKYIEDYINFIKGRLYKKMNENNQRSLTHQQIDRYIDRDETVFQNNIIHNKVSEMYLKFDTLCNAYTSRGFTLKNLTDLFVAQVEEREL